MQLIGMLDSPYVRRVAISLLALDLPFTHRSISVFRGYDVFSTLNPVVKAPTLLCDDGTMLMDSSLILDYAQALARPRTLLPLAPAALAQALHAVGLALAACEKSVQIVYEHHLRPEEKRHAPWLERVTAQLAAAYTALEAHWRTAPPADDSVQALGQAGITSAVAWHFTQQLLPGTVDPAAHPALAALSAAAERLPAFARAAHGDGTVA